MNQEKALSKEFKMALELQNIISAFPKLEESLTKLEEFCAKNGHFFFIPEEKRLKKVRYYMNTFANFFKEIGWKTCVTSENGITNGDVSLYRGKNPDPEFQILFKYENEHTNPIIVVSDLRSEKTDSKQFSFDSYKNIINYIITGKK